MAGVGVIADIGCSVVWLSLMSEGFRGGGWLAADRVRVCMCVLVWCEFGCWASVVAYGGIGGGAGWVLCCCC